MFRLRGGRFLFDNLPLRNTERAFGCIRKWLCIKRGPVIFDIYREPSCFETASPNNLLPTPSPSSSSPSSIYLNRDYDGDMRHALPAWWRSSRPPLLHLRVRTSHGRLLTTTTTAMNNWHKLPISPHELDISTVLRCGQSFRCAFPQVPLSTQDSNQRADGNNTQHQRNGPAR
jgi:hypothetical protein